MSTRHSPIVLRLRLGLELRKRRQAFGLNVDQVSKKVGWSAAKVSRLETGKTAPEVGDVMDLVELFDTPPAEVDELVALARSAKKRGWWQEFGDLSDGLSMYVGFEAAAAVIRDFEMNVIPGLLQTEEHARAIFRAGPTPPPDKQVERKVALRMARQRILDDDDPPHLFAVVHEAALRQLVGGEEVMRRQLEHLAVMAERPNVELQVLTFEAGAHRGVDSGFVILDLPQPDDYTLVYIGLYLYAEILDKPNEISAYKLAFEHLRAVALSPEQSLKKIKSLTKEIGR